MRLNQKLIILASLLLGLNLTAMASNNNSIDLGQSSASSTRSSLMVSQGKIKDLQNKEIQLSQRIKSEQSIQQILHKAGFNTKKMVVKISKLISQKNKLQSEIARLENNVITVKFGPESLESPRDEGRVTVNPDYAPNRYGNSYVLKFKKAEDGTPIRQ